MDQYFITQQGVMRRLMQIRKDASSNAGRLSTVIATSRDGTEIQGIEEVLLDLRAGRVEFL
ncbi:hypothetical protein [Caballeronia sp. HLA56]